MPSTCYIFAHNLKALLMFTGNRVCCSCIEMKTRPTTAIADEKLDSFSPLSQPCFKIFTHEIQLCRGFSTCLVICSEEGD